LVLVDVVQISIHVNTFSLSHFCLSIFTDGRQVWTSVLPSAVTTLHTASLVSIMYHPAAQSVRTAAKTPHATPSITSARAPQPSPWGRLKQQALVAPEVVRVPVPINVLRLMGEDVAHSILNVAAVLAFL
jgi:hypothetical protein